MTLRRRPTGANGLIGAPDSDPTDTRTVPTFYTMKKLLIILNVAIAVAVVLFLESCYLEENFIPDPSDPRLPKYTENGNQVGGALVNGLAWKTDYQVGFNYTNTSFYFIQYSSGDSVTLRIEGIFMEGKSKDRPLDFVVVLKNRRLEKLEDIKNFAGQTLVLDGSSAYAMIDNGFLTIGDSVEYYYGGTGEITFQAVKPVTRITLSRQNGGERYHPLIVAGKFEFHFEQDSIDVTLGRFDFQINDDELVQR